ncbi:MAG: ABC transporter ATP-binding protein [Acidobacteriota bacterium]
MGDGPEGPLIELEGVTKIFGSGETRTVALDEVDLRIERGEFVAVEGPSGCGKSTLLSIVGLLETPSRGTYRLAGRDVGSLSRAARTAARNRDLGFVFQSFNLIGELSVAENVELPLTYQGLGREERQELLDAALERFDLVEDARKAPGQLSGGHQQRVAVARAVVGRPAILLADEPTGNLNSSQAEAVIGMLKELHDEGSTILLVTHDPRWLRLVSRSVRLFDGRVEAPNS